MHSDRLIRKSVRSRLTALASGIAVAAFAAAACASAAAQPIGDHGSQGRIGAICQGAMGLEQGEAQYGACVESLRSSASDLAADVAMGRARTRCLAEGLTPGSTDFNVCELNTAPAERAAVRATPASAPPRAAGSYFYASPEQTHRREQLACASLGYDPAGAAFDSCVAGLQGALFEADNPSQ